MLGINLRRATIARQVSVRIRFIPQPSTMIFRLDNVDPRLGSTLQAAYWQALDNGWQRDYPIDTPLLDRVQQTFATNAEAMFRQMAGLDPVPWEDALDAWISRASSNGIRWWLTGSGATALRVDGINPHDLDIMIEPTQLDLVRKAFADVLIEPLTETDGWFMHAFGVLFLHARIDLAAAPDPTVDAPDPTDFGPYAADHLEEITWRGHPIRVPPLALQVEANRRRGRHARAARIEAVMTHQ